MMMLMTSMFGCAACSSNGASKEAADVSANDDVPTDFQIQYTTAVPSEFFQTASQQGTIELVEYESKDYTSASRPTTHKPAYVYSLNGTRRDTMQRGINIVDGRKVVR